MLTIVPVAVILCTVLSLFFMFLLRKTVFGARVYAVGANAKTAFLSGVRNERVVLFIYAISGLCASLASLVLTGDMGAVSLGLGGDYALDSIAAVVIGGTAFVGGIGGLTGTMAGAYIIKLLTALLQKEIAQEVDRLFSRVLGGSHEPAAAVELEATEMAVRSSMFRVRGVLLEFFRPQ